MVSRSILVRTHGTVIGSREFELFTCSGLFCGAVGLRVLLLFCGVLEEEGGVETPYKCRVVGWSFVITFSGRLTLLRWSFCVRRDWGVLGCFVVFDGVYRAGK